LNLKIPQISILNIFLSFLIFGFINIFIILILLNKADIFTLFHSLFYLVPLIIAIIIIKKFGEKKHTEIKDYIIFKNKFVYIFFSTFLFLIASYNLNLLSPGIMLFVCSLLFTIILVQVFFSKINIWIFFIELIFLLLFIIFRVTLGYPLYFGATDILPHLEYANVILFTGHLLPIDYNSAYTYFPLLHIFNVISSILMNIDPRSSFFVISGISFCSSILILYIIISSIFGKKISLISCLLFSTTNTIIFFGLYMVPRTWAFYGFILLLYCIIKLGESKNNSFCYMILSLIFSVFLVCVHHGSNFPIIIVISIFLIFGYLFYKSSKKNCYPFFIYFLIFIFYIMLIAERTGASFVRKLFEAPEAEIVTTKTISAIPIINSNFFTDTVLFILNNSFEIIFCFFILIGIGVMIIKKDDSKYSFVFIALSLFSLSFWFSPVLVYFPIFTHLVLDRFVLFTIPFIFATFGFSIYHLMNVSYNHKVTQFIIIILFFSFSFLSLGNIPFTDYNFVSELHLQDTTGFTPYFSQEELDIFMFVYTNTDDGSLISTDLAASRFFEGKQYFNGVKNFNLKYFELLQIMDFKSSDLKQSYLIFRKGELMKTNKLRFPLVELTNYNYGYYENNINSQNIIYSSNSNLLIISDLRQ